MNKAPLLIVDAFDAIWGVYGTLADSAGHLPVRDRYHRLWVLVEVAGRLRSRRAFLRDTPHVNDSRDIHGLDSRAVLNARDLIDAHGPLTVEPTQSPVLMPLHLGYSDLTLCAMTAPLVVAVPGSESSA